MPIKKRQGKADSVCLLIVCADKSPITKGASLEHYHSQVLILGSGAAGLRAAIAAREKGVDVTVISKGATGMGTLVAPRFADSFLCILSSIRH